MKRILGMPDLLLAPIDPSAGSTASPTGRFYLLVGTYTQGRSEGIYLYRFNAQLGSIHGPVGLIRSANPSFIVRSHNRQLFFAVNENASDANDCSGGRISSFRFNPRTGEMHEVDSRESQGDEPTYASISPDGRYLFVANYASLTGGSLAVIRAGSSGALGAVRQCEAYPGSGVNRDRQATGHMHSAVMTPSGEYLFAADLGADKVMAYRYRPDNPDRPLEPAEPPYFPAPPGSGPRHMVFSEDGRFAYLTLELSGAVMSLSHSGGRLTELQALPLAPTGFSGQVAAGALHLSADGRFLLVLNRGDDNHLIVFSVNPDNGLLTFADRSPVGRMPREFVLAADGRFVLVANQGDNSVDLFSRNPESGQLGDKLQSIHVDTPAFLALVPMDQEVNERDGSSG